MSSDIVDADYLIQVISHVVNRFGDELFRMVFRFHLPQSQSTHLQLEPSRSIPQP